MYIYLHRKCKEEVYISVHFLTILDHQKPGSVPSDFDSIGEFGEINPTDHGCGWRKWERREVDMGSISPRHI